MGTTPTLGLPYPEDSDPIANMAAAIAALATAIESVHPRKWRAGVVSASTDASGDLTITHGLGVTPTTVLAVPQTNTSAWIVGVHTFTSTTFKVRFRIANTAAVVASTPVALHWNAIA